MAELFSVTAPLMIRFPDGRKYVMAERFPHPEGLLFFDMFWHRYMPASRAMHLVTGAIRGDGPWRVGDAVVTVLGCHGTDPEMASAYSEWQAFLETGAPGYPSPEAIRELAISRGAVLSS